MVKSFIKGPYLFDLIKWNLIFQAEIFYEYRNKTLKLYNNLVVLKSEICIHAWTEVNLGLSC